MQDPSLAYLLTAAAEGDQAAWDTLVSRFERLVWATIRGFRLPRPTADDVSQTVWLRLVEHLDRIEDPERLGAWIATTTRNECIRYARTADRVIPTDDIETFDRAAPPAAPVDAALVEAERTEAFRRAFGQLSAACQQLLTLLMQDPPLGYEAIAASLGRPIGSLGPSRARCLDRVRTILASEGHPV